MRKLQTKNEIFEYILNLDPQKLSIIIGERKYTNGYDFSAFLLYHCAVELHKIDPYITFGLLRATQLYLVTNDRAFHTFFYQFCLTQQMMGLLPVVNVRTGTSFGLGTQFIVRYVNDPHDLAGTAVAGAIVSKDFDPSNSLFDAVQMRIESRFKGSCRAERLIALVHLV